MILADAWSVQVRGLARRFSEFRELDLQLRVLFSSLPPLPGRRVFGSLSAPLVAEVHEESTSPGALGKHFAVLVGRAGPSSTASPLLSTHIAQPLLDTSLPFT
jgi:hypothetical protein